MLHLHMYLSWGWGGVGGIGTIREDSWSNLISTVENCAVVISRRGVRGRSRRVVLSAVDY